MISPASIAPIAIDRPAAQVSAATPRLESRVRAMKLSGWRLEARWWNTGRTSRLPIR